MIWLLLLALGGAPFLGTPVTRREKNGTWTCSAVCHTSGNDDAGYCRSAVFTKNWSTEDACKVELKRQCSEKKPPPGGCR